MSIIGHLGSALFYSDQRTPLHAALDSFGRDISGATAIEYGLIVALIAVGIVIAATKLGADMSMMFNVIASKFDTSAA